MKILNTTTGKIEELSYLSNEVDVARDIIGNAGCLVWDAERETYTMDDAAVAWWREYLENAHADEAKRDELAELYSCDEIAQIAREEFTGDDLNEEHAAWQRVFARVLSELTPRH